MTLPSDRRVYDVAVIGAGPAGLSAAVTAAQRGAAVVLLDAGAALGGQFWRQPADPELAERTSRYQHDRRAWQRLRSACTEQVERGRLVVCSRHEVWTVGVASAGFEIRAVCRAGSAGVEQVVLSGTLVLAPGAYDRQIPFPGWDLPGVLTAGGAQALLKGSDVAAGKRVLVAGTGPFLLPVAAGLAMAGARVVGVHEAAASRDWLKDPAALLGALPKLTEGLSYAATLLRHWVPYRTRSTVLAAHGSEQLEAVTVARLGPAGEVRPGTERRIEVDTLAVGWGFTPQVELPLALGCAMTGDQHGTAVVVTDDEQMTTVDGVFVAGEACGVGGAALAQVEGVIAGAAAAEVSQRTGLPESLARLRRRRTTLRRFASLMHAAHPVPSGWRDRLGGAELVCRCEEVTADRLKGAVEAFGVQDARAAKLLTRVGMGWCQGRVCGYATSCLVAGWSGRERELSALGAGPVAAPISLGALAAISDESTGLDTLA